jgi:hypothetical protein
MNISSISSNTSGYLPTQSNNEIKALEKQKERLQDQIQKTKESDTDVQTKQELIKQLQEQIQQIDAQIQQKRSEMLSDKLKQNSSSEKSSNQETSQKTETENAVGSISTKGMTDFFEASSSYEKATLMSDTKNKLDGRSGILSQEIALDEARGIDPKAKRTELAENKAKSINLNIDFGEALCDSKSQAREATGEEAEKAKESSAYADSVLKASAEPDTTSVNSGEEAEESNSVEKDKNGQQVWIIKVPQREEIDILV